VLLLAACGEWASPIERGAIQSPAGDTSDDQNRPATIQALQGSGRRSPLEGESVVVEGIVTGDFQDNDADPGRNLGGFYIQSLNPDDDVRTSDGVFVFDREAPGTDVIPGNVVRVSGRVVEHFGETQIVADDVLRTGSMPASEWPAPHVLSFPLPIVDVDGEWIADLESFEGMHVVVEDSLVVSGINDVARFGEILLSHDERLYQFTNSFDPSVQGYAAFERETAARSLRIDDGQAVRNPDDNRFVDWSDSANRNYSLRTGDRLTGVVGNVRYSRGSGASGVESFRLEPTAMPAVNIANPRPESAPARSGKLRVASLNALNYFASIDDSNNRCGPTNEECRGADSSAEKERQLGKLSRALVLLNADIIGLVEIENDGGAALREIADAMNAANATGDNVWAGVNAGLVGTDTIAVGFLFRRDTVQALGDPAKLTMVEDPRFDDDRNRVPLAQTFRHIATTNEVTVVVNHFKSKGSSCETDDDPNLADGQGNCAKVRASAANALADWLGNAPTGSTDPDFLIIGDLNAYLREDAVRNLERAGYVNLLDNGSGEESYSFVFDGRAGLLDHALATPSLAEQVVSASIWHINADELRIIDYNLDDGRPRDDFDSSTPYRVSDHDPVLIDVFK